MAQRVVEPEEIREKYQDFIISNNPNIAFADFLDLAIHQNYLLISIVTSHTQGRIKSTNLPYGVGKTTFALWTSYIVNSLPGTYPNPKTMTTDEMQEAIYRYNPFDLSIPEVRQNWDNVFNNLVYNILDLFRMVKPGAPRRKIIVFDDAAATAPAERGVPKVMYKLKGYLTTTRPEVACMMMTASNRNEIVSPLRKLIVLEIIVAQRGIFEVQAVKFYKNFRNPELDISRLEYMEEGVFPPLPPEIQRRYDSWRKAEKEKLFPNIEIELERWLKLGGGELTGENVVEANVIHGAGKYIVRLPDEIGRKCHFKKVKVILPDTEEDEAEIETAT
jgi:hypothetical protein